ncbi:hypothetical protein MPSI1_003332 [Malassezia psittaci]|uniref:Uncharacterized protein n=1 Tax=Malassezia psittaci TaxID=1821823 RepID=A0AAF0FHJ9_9BASI|nr:hypothetical protein MPSI1_003332 [Malassezia psittaci]
MAPQAVEYQDEDVSQDKELTIRGIARSKNQQVPNLSTQLFNGRSNLDHDKDSREPSAQSTSNISPSQHTRDEMQSDSPETLQKYSTSTSSDSQIPSCFLPLPMTTGDRTWGLGTERKQGADQAIGTKMAHFHHLKTQGTHFNHTLARNRSFHNPHINDKLVNWVGLDETGTNFSILADMGSSAISWDPKSPNILQEGDIASLCMCEFP